MKSTLLSMAYAGILTLGSVLPSFGGEKHAIVAYDNRIGDFYGEYECEQIRDSLEDADFNVTFLPNATRSKLKTSIDDLARETNSDDTIVIHVSAHGSNGNIVLKDGDVHWKDFGTWTNSFGDARFLTTLNVCYAGDFAKIADKKNEYVLSPCSPYERAGSSGRSAARETLNYLLANDGFSAPDSTFFNYLKSAAQENSNNPALRGNQHLGTNNTVSTFTDFYDLQEGVSLEPTKTKQSSTEPKRKDEKNSSAVKRVSEISTDTSIEDIDSFQKFINDMRRISEGK